MRAVARAKNLLRFNLAYIICSALLILNMTLPQDVSCDAPFVGKCDLATNPLVTRMIAKRKLELGSPDIDQEKTTIERNIIDFYKDAYHAKGSNRLTIDQGLKFTSPSCATPNVPISQRYMLHPEGVFRTCEITSIPESGVPENDIPSAPADPRSTNVIMVLPSYDLYKKYNSPNEHIEYTLFMLITDLKSNLGRTAVNYVILLPENVLDRPIRNSNRYLKDQIVIYDISTACYSLAYPSTTGIISKYYNRLKYNEVPGVQYSPRDGTCMPIYTDDDFNGDYQSPDMYKWPKSFLSSAKNIVVRFNYPETRDDALASDIYNDEMGPRPENNEPFELPNGIVNRLSNNMLSTFNYHFGFQAKYVTIQYVPKTNDTVELEKTIMANVYSDGCPDVLSNSIKVADYKPRGEAPDKSVKSHVDYIYNLHCLNTVPEDIKPVEPVETCNTFNVKLKLSQYKEYGNRVENRIVTLYITDDPESEFYHRKTPRLYGYILKSLVANADIVNGNKTNEAEGDGFDPKLIKHNGNASSALKNGKDISMKEGLAVDYSQLCPNDSYLGYPQVKTHNIEKYYKYKLRCSHVNGTILCVPRSGNTADAPLYKYPHHVDDCVYWWSDVIHEELTRESESSLMLASRYYWPSHSYQCPPNRETAPYIFDDIIISNKLARIYDKKYERYDEVNEFSAKQKCERNYSDVKPGEPIDACPGDYVYTNIRKILPTGCVPFVEGRAL